MRGHDYWSVPVVPLAGAFIPQFGADSVTIPEARQRDMVTGSSSRCARILSPVTTPSPDAKLQVSRLQ